MITITATAESLEQAKLLMDAGVDRIYAGDGKYGLRLPHSFEGDALKELVQVVHEAGKEIVVPVNAIMTPELMEGLLDYYRFLESLHVDFIELGDAGAIHMLKKNNIQLPFIYNAQMLITNARQIEFWTKKGAVAAVLGREVPYAELKKLAPQITIPAEMLVYGATCIHQSRRPLVQNYANYIQADIDVTKDGGLFLAEPKHENTHHSIYEDEHGTHIFANNDLDLMPYLEDLHKIGLDLWKLDGLYTSGKDFVKIAQCFAQAKEAIENEQWNDGVAQQLDNIVREYHPKERGLDEGFFNFAPEDVQ